MKKVGYTIEATSPEGVYYYLVNGWYKNYAFGYAKKIIQQTKQDICPRSPLKA